MSSPAVQGDGPGRPRSSVSPKPPSTVRHTRSISGAIRRSTMSVRQSNDCTLTRAVRPAARTAAATVAAKVSGSAVSAPEPGVSLVSALKRTCSAPLRRARSNTSNSAGMRAAVELALLRGNSPRSASRA